MSAGAVSANRGRTLAWAGVLGALLVGLGVAIGALGAHYLVGRIPVAREATLDTGVLYQFVSGLGLLLIAALANGHAVSAAATRWLLWAARSLAVGVLLFSGSLYALVAGGPSIMGAVAPLGGVAMIAGWAALAVAVSKR